MTHNSPTNVRTGSRLPRGHSVAHQARYDLRCFWRNTQSRFFTLVLPVMFLVIFASVFQGQDVAVAGGRLNVSSRASLSATSKTATAGIAPASSRPVRGPSRSSNQPSSGPPSAPLPMNTSR